MYNICKLNNVSNIPDIKKLFSNTDNLNADVLRSTCMNILNNVSDTSDKIVSKVCNAQILPQSVECVEDKPLNDEDDIVWEKEEKFMVDNQIDFKTLTTTSAHRFMKPTLIVTVNIMKFLENFQQIVDDFIKEFGTVKNINDQYTHKLNLWKKQVDRADKNMNDSNITCKEDRLRNDESIGQSKPSLRFDGYQINTVNHIKKYAKNTKNAIDKHLIRPDLDVTDIIVEEMVIPDNIRILLACGIGVIGLFGGKYTAKVNSLMTDGKLAFIVADSSIAYGTNVPINNVIVTKEFSDVHSINTLNQVISRAGRVGRSWKAEAFVDKSCADKLLSALENFDDIELNNLEKIHHDLIESNIDVDDMLILELAKKKLEEIEAEKKEKERIEREEAERLKKEEEERIKKEEDARRLEELKKRRGQNQPQRVVQISEVFNKPPTQNVEVSSIVAGFKRNSTTNNTRSNRR